MAGGVFLLVAGQRLGRRRVVLLRPALRHDAPGFPFDVQDGVRCLGHEFNRVVIDLDDPLHAGEPGGQVRALGPDPVGGEQDIVGGEVLAPVELHPAPQMEAPAVGGHDLPPLGERRLDGEVGTAPDQPLVNVADEAQRERLVQRIGIHRIRISLEGEAKLLGLGGGGGGEGERDDGEGQLGSHGCVLRSSPRSIVTATREVNLRPSACSTIPLQKRQSCCSVFRQVSPALSRQKYENPRAEDAATT